ncbi:hypothetical protein M9458_029306, partial [Cirrhinus mrigala]
MSKGWLRLRESSLMLQPQQGIVRLALKHASTESPWILSIIEKGYRLRFAVKPQSFNGVVMSTAQGESAQALEEEIPSLLNK